jgi:hypothetical protein
MNDREISAEELKAMKESAKNTANQWVDNGFYTIWSPSNNKTYNDNCIRGLNHFNDQLKILPGLDKYSWYLWKYVIRKIIEIIECHSENTSFSSGPTRK